MNENERTLRRLAACKLLSVSRANLRLQLMDAINGNPSMFQCAVQDGKVTFSLDPATPLGIDQKELAEFYRNGEPVRVTEKEA